MPNERTIAEKVHELLFSFGKLGVLIEDAPDACLRTARELYGTDGLPLWWLHYDNQKEGAEALKVAWEAVSQGIPDWAQGLPLLVVLDRYLKESPTSSRAVAWDENDQHSIGKEVINILTADKEGLPVHLEAVTSYAGSTQNSKTSGIETWSLRHHEPLYQLQRRIAEGTPNSFNKLQSLLVYGPAEEPPLSGYKSKKNVYANDRQTDKELKNAALCRALYWQKSVVALIEALRDADAACVLLTGAGASLANDPLAPGIPDTSYLLDYACWETKRHLLDRPRPVWQPRAARAKPEEKISNLDMLLKIYEDGKSARDFDWSLERLFNHKGQNDKKFQRFVAAFRLALQLWDHDFPYQSWLFSQLPWTLILTTNFDGFHERAAANAVTYSSPPKAEKILRLGNPLPVLNAGDKIAQGPGTNTPSSSTENRPWSFEEFKDGPGLLKPYGSLMTMGSLALTHDDFWSRINWVKERYVEPIMASCTKLWIVIVGQRLSSEALNTVLTNLLKNKEHNKKLRILWVEPYPYSNENLENFECLRRCHDVLEEMAAVDFSKDEAVVCPLPARALDFAFDLWSKWNEPP